MQHTMLENGLITVVLGVTLTAGCATNRTAGAQFDDALLTSKINAKLAVDPDVNPVEVDVDTTDGAVRLSGWVETESERAAAERIARDTRGVASVTNEIQLGDPSAGETVNDAIILTKVKAKLTGDPEINPLNIDVDVQRGVVTLSGEVERFEQRQEAEKLVRQTQGVKAVRNDLIATGS